MWTLRTFRLVIAMAMYYQTTADGSIVIYTYLPTLRNEVGNLVIER